MKISDGSRGFQIHIREYTAEDRESCLGIFASNMDSLPESPEVLADFLIEGTSWFLVAERDGKVVACGGLELQGDTNRGMLVFGMVDKAQQRCGIGTLLTLTRLTLVPDEDATTMVTLETNVLNEGFYSRFGFERIGLEKSRYEKQTFVDLGLWVTDKMKEDTRALLRTMPVTFAEGILA